MLKNISARKAAIIFVLLFALPAISLAGDFEVVRVYDGVTLKARGCDIEIKVRLIGIDDPGKRQSGRSYRQEAKKFLTGLVLNRTVEIKGYGLDRYNRILGVVFLFGKDINLELVKAGLAEVYRGKQPKGFDLTPYRLAEREARAAGYGMWE